MIDDPFSEDSTWRHLTAAKQAAMWGALRSGDDWSEAYLPYQDEPLRGTGALLTRQKGALNPGERKLAKKIGQGARMPKPKRKPYKPYKPKPKRPKPPPPPPPSPVLAMLRRIRRSVP